MPKQHRRDERLSRKQMLSQVSEVTLKRFAKKKPVKTALSALSLHRKQWMKKQ